VTVAVLDPEDRRRRPLDLREVDITKTLGTGPGGQHRNKTESCVIATHRPSGLTVRVDMRSQHQSLAMALAILGARLEAAADEEATAQRNAARRSQVGAGMRGDKVRTYREQDERITDHRDGRTFPLSRWLRGDWDPGTS
jgi:peptide chain release factor 1